MSFGTKNYVAAKDLYRQAYSMQPNDMSLQGKFTQAKKKADPIILRMMVKKGDSAFQANELVIARKAYDSALVIKQGDAYCKAQLKKIATLENFNSIVNKANALAAAATTVQQYDLAINEYRYALALFPSRDYPKDQIKELKRKRDELTRQLSMNKNR
jgi:tetratricopeptide (TPR) repeat protein